MGYQIRMVPEVERWLAGLRDRDPAAADRIDEAVAALRAGGASAGPPLVVPVDDRLRPGRAAPGPARGTASRVRGPSSRGSVSGAAHWLLTRTGSRLAFPGLDSAYQLQLERLTPVRRAVADVATSRKRLELQIGELERQGAAEERLTDLRRRYADLQAEEERVSVASQRLQARIDAFRTCKEAAQAAYTAAEEAAEAAWVQVAGDRGAGPEGAAPAAGDADHAGPGGPAQPAPWLSELRPGAPDSPDARILFTVEPPGLAVLLDAGTDSDRLEAWYTETAARCRVRYQRERSRTR